LAWPGRATAFCPFVDVSLALEVLEIRIPISKDKMIARNLFVL
jgi:hypothetical protein